DRQRARRDARDRRTAAAPLSQLHHAPDLAACNAQQHPSGVAISVTASIALLPLATVFALEFTTPAWTTLLAVVLLGERLTASRIGAVALGLAGVLVIVRPGVATFQPAALLVLTAAVGYACTYIATKKLTTTDSTFAIVLW